MEMQLLEAAPTLSPRDVMVRISQRLGAQLGDSDDAILAFIIDNHVAVNIGTDGDRLAVFCRVADVSQMSPKAWVALLSEAANWGIDGESMRFAVMDPFVALMWSEPATEADAMLARLERVMSRAVAVARMIRNLRTRH